jgi:hypothetical protein
MMRILRKYNPKASLSLVGLSVIVCAFMVVACGRSSGAASARSSNTVQVDHHERVLMLPPMGAGFGGWCLATVQKAVGCRSVSSQAFDGPIVTEAWTGYGLPSTFEGLVLTTNEVAAVSLEGHQPTPTNAGLDLPAGFRAAFVEERTERIPGGAFVALSASGEPIQNARQPGSPLEFSVASLPWSGRQPSPGTCDIDSTAIHGIAVQNARVVAKLGVHKDLRGREFIDCAEADYVLNGKWPIAADLLIDAEHPGSSPALLPAMRRYHGVFLGPVGQNTIAARRVSGGWLVVTNGRDLRQRIEVLHHLKTSVARGRGRS